MSTHRHHPPRTLFALALISSLFLVSGCNSGDNKISSATDYREIEWTELIPEDDLQALLNPPEFLNDIVDGSEEDQISSQLQTTPDQAPETAYQKALVSSNIVESFDEQNIRIPGFIVPLEFDENLVVSEFFLVPYFGACLHTPPPPPNQIIFIKHEDGIKIDSIEQPYWVSGILTTRSEVNDMAHAAYSMAATKVEPYDVIYEE